MKLKKNAIFVAVSVVFGLILFGGVLRHVGLGALFEVAKKINAANVALAVIPFFMAFVFSARRWQILLKEKYNKDITIGASFISAVIDATASYVSPFTAFIGGEPVRAYFLTKQIDIRFTDSFTASFIDKLIEMIGYLLVVVLGVSALAFRASMKRSAEMVVLGVLFFAFIGLAFYIYRKIKQKKSFFSPLFDFLGLDRFAHLNHLQEKAKVVEQNVIHFFHTYNGTFRKMLTLTVLSKIFLIFSFYLLLHFLGIPAGPIKAVAVTGVLIFSYLIPLPASIGTSEAVITLGFSLLGLRPEQGVLFALASRIFYIIMLSIGSVFMVNHLNKSFFAIIKEKIKIIINI